MPPAPLDRIFIQDLHLRTIIGINDWERTSLQDVIIGITLYADLSQAASSDRIEDTIDYKTLSKRVISLTESSSFLLVERLAAAIMALCLEDPRVQEATVEVQKPGALRFSRSVGVSLHRRRSDSQP
ncbi:MAG: dihydroneopterin aldolase [Magnetococcus sp. WYHC-3]